MKGDENKSKIALITSEGGLSCAYSVGVILSLIENYNFTHPDIVIGSSGSTGTLAYYVSGQYASIKNIWENLLSTNKFVSYFRINKIIDIDYLIDTVFGKQDVLDTDAVNKSKIDLYIGATDVSTGLPFYFSNRTNDDIFEALRASSAMPMVYRKKVKIKDSSYIDGAISANISENISKAKQLGATKIIVIDTVNHNFASNFPLKIYSLFCNKNLSGSIKQYFNSNYNNQLNENILVIKPSKKIPVSSLDNKREHLLEAIKLGYEDTLKNNHIAPFII